MPESSSGISIERCNSVERGEELKMLFHRNGYPEFAAVFDRAYAHAYAAGGASWIARDAAGMAVGHLGVFPRMFRDGSRAVRGALLVDYLFDLAQRNFFAPAQLCRRMVADVRASGDVDFSYSDPMPPAVPSLMAAGFSSLGALQRLVMPTHPLYVGACALRARARRLAVERVTKLYDASITQGLGRLTGGGFRAARSAELYGTRLGGVDLCDCEWLVVPSGPDATAGPVALVLVSGKKGRRLLNIVDLLWDDRRVSPESVLIAAARAAWAGGYTRLGMTTLAPSGFARLLKRCGFIRRRDALPLLLLPIGRNPLPPLESWLLTFFDGSGW